MKKILLIFNFTFLIFNSAFSQAGEWVWMHGDSIPTQSGNYGVQGIPSPTNNPPGLYEPCEWADPAGNFWLFGGYKGAYLADLWKYDGVSNEWTWINGGGTLNDAGNYGIQGVSSPTNRPPSRGYGVTTWTDTAGNFWMFGGASIFGDRSDLWKYDVSTNQWIWMKGPSSPGQQGIYGTRGIPAPSNNPCSRWECAAAWTDNAGDLWLFGGYDSNSHSLNDLWRYTLSTNEWTWMKGSQFSNQAGIYGIQGIEDSVNTPGARMSYSHWKEMNGNLWLFGGFDFSFTYNDLWRYDPVTDNWTWMKGSNSGIPPGVYGTKCIPASANVPGGRYESRSVCTDEHGMFWLFGGGQYAATNVLNDLWSYCVTSNQWTWQSGDNFPNPSGSWGIQGVSSPANKPDGRFGSITWSDHNGHIYMFGGVHVSPFSSPYNDLWKFTIDTACGTCPTSTDIEKNNPSKVDELLVFPNPANSSLTISFSSFEKQNIELRIYNTLGKQIYFSKEEITKGKFEKEINVEKLSGGIYFLQVKTKEGNKSRKVIVSHP